MGDGDGDSGGNNDTVQVDARGLDCPLPLLHAKRALNIAQPGQRVRVLATDSGTQRDFPVFAQRSGHRLLASEEYGGGVLLHTAEMLKAFYRRKAEGSWLQKS